MAGVQGVFLSALDFALIQWVEGVDSWSQATIHPINAFSLAFTTFKKMESTY